MYEDDQQRFLVTHGADYCIAHRLEDGGEIWRCGNLHPKGAYNKTLRFVASPACSPGLIVVPTAKKGKVIGIRPGGSGDITDSEDFVAWTLPRNTPDVPSPVIHDGLVYLCRENGNLMALDAETGKLIYEERTTRERHRSSPVYADGNLYLTARNGVVTVVRAGKDFFRRSPQRCRRTDHRFPGLRRRPTLPTDPQVSLRDWSAITSQHSAIYNNKCDPRFLFPPTV